jgi:hypothetical protein
MSGLAERILDAFPAGQYGLTALLRLLDIVETTDVPSAAVEVALQPRMKVNPVFVSEQANTPEKLLMLVMHELHHVLLGHTKLFQRISAADNIVFDAVINSLLCRMFPQPEYVAFFTSQNSDAHFPDCLLRPPPRWNPARQVKLPRGLRDASARTQWAYTALYSETGADYYDLFETLRSELKDAHRIPVLLGNHEGFAVHLEDCPGLFEAVREIVERWPQPPSPIAGRSLADTLVAQQHPPMRVPSNRQILTSLIRKVARMGVGRNGKGWTDRETCTPIFGFDRRDIVMTALGRPPLLYRHSTRGHGRAGLEPVHIYVDVSGSIGELKGALYGAVLDCRELVKPRIHLFSTKIHDVSLAELRQGICRTTGGTDISSVAAHMAAHNVRRAVLLTDGFVGRARGSHANALRSAHIGVALTPGYSARTDLEPVVRHWAELRRNGHEQTTVSG